MKKREIGTLFPNTNPMAASYSPIAFCITLNHITEQQLNQVRHNNVDLIDRRRIVYHEMRHNIDHLSTLWGQQSIFDCYEAIDGRMQQDENQFYKIIKYKSLEKQYFFNDYYKEDYMPTTYSTPADAWIWTLSSGIRYDHLGKLTPDNPIFFIKFVTQKGAPVNRVPVSVAALLETNAIYEECVVEQEYLGNIAPERQLKERIVLEHKMLKDIIYNQDMAVYNCAVHLCANLLKINDTYQALKISAAVATLALNLPPNTTARIPVQHASLSAWGNRPVAFISKNNLGFLYYILLLNYEPTFNKTGSYSLDDLLAANNLPPKEDIERSVSATFSKLTAKYAPSGHFNKFFKSHSISGLEILKLRGIDGMKASLKQILTSGKYAPFIVAKNTSFPENVTFANAIHGERLDDIDIRDWYHLAWNINIRLEEFYKIRGL